MILDTNALSAFADNDAALLRVLPRDRPWYLPVIAIGEYRFGLMGSRERTAREAWLDRLTSVVTVLEISANTALHYAAVRHELKAANQKIPPNDSWIAALAREHGMSIITRDNHFDLVHGVTRVGW
jgi:tRNA(fMet)-specific endonuclease VapC